MRILVLSRPIINGGDFLFTERSVELFKTLLPNDDVVSGHISKNYSLEEMNTFDKIIVAGGPLYDNSFLICERFPLLGMINNIQAKVHFFACGWYGRNVETSTVYGYRFSEEVRENLKAIVKKGGKLGCRDYITERVLNNNGFNQTVMTGCSAWYDLDYINNLCAKVPSSVKKIAVSDQGMTKDATFHNNKFFQVVKVLDLIRHKYPEAEIIYTFNGGIDTKFSAQLNKKICTKLDELSLKYYDLSGGAEGFSAYNDVDLHIGFRVHSHIYCLSRGIPSVLIEEDARGFGVNETLGLRCIKNYAINNENAFEENRYLVQELDAYLNNLEEEKYISLGLALKRIKYTYENTVIGFLNSL